MLNWLFACCTSRNRKRTMQERQIVRPRDLGAHRARALTLGDIAVGSSGTPMEPLWKSELSILSYNIFCRPDVPMTNFTEYQELRIDLFVEYVLPHHDIVSLQEMFHMPMTSRRYRFIELAKSSGFYWTHHSSRNSSLSPSIDGGLLILSRFPIVKTDILTFSSSAFADWYASKGVLYCLIQVGPTKSHYMHFFSTHLQATYNEESRHVSEKVRANQLNQLATFVAKSVEATTNGDAWPIVITGDVNVQCRKSATDGSDSSEYLAMMKILRDGLGFKGQFIRDLAREIDGLTHPVTYGDSHIDLEGNVHPREVSLTDAEELRKNMDNCNQSLDKIFWVPPTDKVAIIQPVSTRINEILIDPHTWKIASNNPLTHLSDHYAIETKVKINMLESDNSSR